MLGQVAAERCEQLLHWLFDASREARFPITTTEAPHYRRVVLQRLRAEGDDGAHSREHAIRRGFGMRDGNGIVFVSHTGEVQPSGFLPLVAGNVWTARPVELYQEAVLFRRLREPGGFEGRCGRCEFREICGGSRARAYAASGSAFGEDPLCPYEPGAGAGVR